ncbi:HAD family hydrolase [Flavobacterium aquidurense]|jgi:phosphonatase-like hydrolase|uniref:phosphonatase-like hydrolase n=1 Tax=Flavobacterium aquidurense TaxID=362413 RepID=UPI0009230ED0|nr:phosphonatase-like hydrolase [Flavobacterium aquidurense]OXA74364.1 HAD family hydrolase [Flavobacterium aquidurense]SHF93990.1 phosphonatase-like hydrolase [Flavobacterium frigidimaris]
MTDIKLVVFDMAGTTVNENNLVYKTVQKVINQEGFSISLDEVLQHGAGKEKHKAITDVLTACTTDIDIATIADKAFGNFKITLETAYDEAQISTFDGMQGFFDTLRKHDIKIVLNTGYDSKTANKLLEKLNWKVGNQIDALITSDDVVNGRPNPDMIQMAMARFGITDPAQVLKAGDSEIDIMEGKNSGCAITVGVLSGAQNREQLQVANPDYILNNVMEIESILFQ